MTAVAGGTEVSRAETASRSTVRRISHPLRRRPSISYVITANSPPVKFIGVHQVRRRGEEGVGHAAPVAERGVFSEVPDPPGVGADAAAVLVQPVDAGGVGA